MPAAGFQCGDESIVHCGPDPLVLGRVHLAARSQELVLLVGVNTTIALRFVSRADVHAETTTS